jgi:hypothetical protein
MNKTAQQVINEMLNEDLNELETRKCSSFLVKAFPLKLQVEQTIKLPLGCNILTLLIDPEDIKLYVEYDNNVEHYTERKFAIYADEQFFHHNYNRAYVGTIQRYMMPTIHVYELLGDAIK